MYPSKIPDLSSESPLIVSGRYLGTFPDTLAVTGIFADMSKYSADLKVHEAIDIPLDKVRQTFGAFCEAQFYCIFLQSLWV